MSDQSKRVTAHVVPTGAPASPGSVSVIKLTADEIASLKAIGWQEGQPIPSELSDRVAQARKAAVMDAAAFRSPAPPDTPPTKIPVAQEISSLAPDQLRALRESVQQANVSMTQLRRKQAMQVPGAGPGVNQAIETGMLGETVRRKPVNISADDAQPQKVSAPRQTDEAPDHSHEPGEEPTAGTEFKLCSRCGWDQAVSYSMADKPTEEDRDRYMACILGGRFRKTYSLYNGKMSVLFHSLTQREEDMALIQLAIDAGKNPKDNKIPTPEEFVTNIVFYRLIMALERITTADGTVIEIPEFDIDTYRPLAKTPDTPLKAFFTQITDAHVSNPSLRRVLLDAYGRFELLQADIEREGHSENFS